MAANKMRLTEIAISSFEWTIPCLTSVFMKNNDFVGSSIYEFCDGPWRLTLFRRDDSIDFILEKKDSFEEHLKEAVVRMSVQINDGDIRFHLPEKTLLADGLDNQHLKFPWTYVGQRDSLKITCEIACPGCERLLVHEQCSDHGLALKRKYPEDDDCWKNKSLRASGADRLRENMKELLNSDEHKDVTIEVKDHQFKAHKNILRARSPVFFSMFSHNMIEKNSGTIHVTDCEPVAFKHFLAYLYTGKLKDVSEDIVFSLYYIGDKYQVEGVKKICVTLMLKYLTVETFCEIVSLLLENRESELVETASKFFVENFRKITATKQWELFLGEYPAIGNDLHILAGYHSATTDLSYDEI